MSEIKYPENKTFAMRLRLILILSLLFACSTTPEDRVSTTTHKAATHFSEQTGTEPTDPLLLTSISTYAPYVPVPCTSGSACAIKTGNHYAIHVGRSPDRWQLHLRHEVYHVLIWEKFPWVDHEDHHRFMLDRRLCFPVSLCGY